MKTVLSATMAAILLATASGVAHAQTLKCPERPTEIAQICNKQVGGGCNPWTGRYEIPDRKVAEKNACVLQGSFNANAQLRR